MGEHVSIDHGHIRIDTACWVARRVGDEHAGLTDALGHWGRAQLLDGYPGRDWMTRAELWCMAREYAVCEGFPTYHDRPWLSADVSILLAVVDNRHAIAIVSVDGDAPTVYADLTTDVGYWYDAGTVQIVCPNEHRWTWRDGELLTDDEAVDPATVFDHHPKRRHDQEHADSDTDLDDIDLDADGRIFCPRCDELCDLRLPEVPRFPQPRQGRPAARPPRPPTDRTRKMYRGEPRHRP